tara:strand:+ start:420 stop:770 length:351 start_codon:yes stop_codon:yes gene_type:complete
MFTSLEVQYFERHGRWLEEDEWWLTIHLHLLSNITLYISGNLSEMTITEESFIAQPEMMTDTEFVSWITEQLDKILNHERPIRYDDVEEIWRGRLGEIDMFCAIFLGTKDMDISIH